MSDDEVGPDVDEKFDPSLPPMGYVYDQAATEETQQAYTSTADLAQFAGATKAMIKQGINYFNLKSFVADLLRRPNMNGIITSQRALIDCGDDGAVLTPLAQQTGICDGCSHGEGIFTADCYRYAMVGGRLPVEYSFMWPYLLGRKPGMKGDNGAYPAYTVRGLHDIGCLPVNCGGKYDLTKMKPHGPNSQESLCIQMRDKPVLFKEWQDASADRKVKVFNPGRDSWMIADTISNGRPVTKGAGYQISPAAGPPSSGVSPLYYLNGQGHETLFEGWAIIGGRLYLITLESWWQNRYPAINWQQNRIRIKPDGMDSKLLYPGQGITLADPYVKVCSDLWGIDWPGSR